MRYDLAVKKRRWPKVLAIVFVLLALLGTGAIIGVRAWYQENLRPVNENQKRVTVTIPLGSSLREIAVLLKNEGLIRSDWAFERYVRNEDLEDSLQAGTYSLQPSQSVQEVVAILTQGKILTDLITILPGQRLDEVRRGLLGSGFSEQAVDAALDPSQYANHPALVDKPTGANLEGYLYPESFQKTASTTPEEVVRLSLDEMQKRLTPEIRNKIVRQGLTVHEGIILASIVEQEVSNPDDKPKVAQVFLKRFKIGMPLGSDITAPYGAILDGQTPSIHYDSAYNTHERAGFPPSPISNISEASLLAVANPASTDWLYFVSGDDGVTYFSKTLAEHEALAQEHCKALCGR